MIKKAFIGFLILLTGGYAAAEVAAKKYAEKSLAENAAANDPLAQSADAEVSFPLLFTLATSQQIKRIEVSTRHVEVGPFIADRTFAVLHNVHIDVSASIRESEPVVDHIDRLDMTVEITQEEASKILPEGVAFRFTDSGVVIAGGGFEARGRFVVPEPMVVAFEPESGSLPGIDRIGWRFEGIPFVTCIKDIRAQAGRIVITCSQEDPPTSFPPAR